MLTVYKVRDPYWVNPEHTMIGVFVTFNENKDTLGEVPFGASPDDPEEHGRKLFKDLKDGVYGPVAEYTVPVPTVDSVRARVNVLSVDASEKIAALQQEHDTLQDAVDFDMATDEEAERLPKAKAELNAWKKYRIFLSRVEVQPGFPADVEWPVAPA